GMHPEDEIQKSVGPLLECVIAGDRPEPVQQRAGTRCVVHARNALHPALASLELLAVRVRVDGHGQGAGACCREGSRQARELPQQGASEATISLTSKSAAPRQESAAP